MIAMPSEYGCHPPHALFYNYTFGPLMIYLRYPPSTALEHGARWSLWYPRDTWLNTLVSLVSLWKGAKMISSLNKNPMSHGSSPTYDCYQVCKNKVMTMLAKLM